MLYTNSSIVGLMKVSAMFPISNIASRQKSKPYVLTNAFTNEELNLQVEKSSLSMGSGSVYLLLGLLCFIGATSCLNKKNHV